MTKSPRARKQNGNMLVGLILGLITGLAIAIAVALYITRAPSPVTPKTPLPEPSAPPFSAQPSVDPNLPLQGNTPAEPAPAPQVPSDTALSALPFEPGQNLQPPPEEIPQAPLDEMQIIEVPSAPSATPKQRPPAEDRPAAAPRAAPPVSRPRAPEAMSVAPAYYLQAGAYRSSADAEAQRVQIALQGFEAKVSRYGNGNVTYYRVRIGPISQLEQMDRMRRQLSEAGIHTVVIRFRSQE